VKSTNLLQAILLAGLLAVSGCSREEPAPVAGDEPAVTDTPAATDAEQPADAGSEATTDSVEVVEESAAEAAPEDAGDAIVLARADVPSATTANFKYKEGVNYARLVPSQPTIGGADKIEVAEFFWYGCPHCYDLEPIIGKWATDLPPNVRFVTVPAIWNQILKVHAQLYYTQEVLARNGVLKDEPEFRKAVFNEYHQRGNRLVSPDAIKRLFARYGVSDEEFDKAWGSFEVAQKMRVAEDLTRRYGVQSVPAIIVNGKYRTGAAEAGGHAKLIEVIDELVARESAR